MAVNSSCECRGENRRSSRTLAPRLPRHIVTASFTSARAGGSGAHSQSLYRGKAALCHFSPTLHSPYTFILPHIRNTLHSNHGWRTTTLRWPDRRCHRCWRRTGKGICTLLRLTRSQCRGQRLGRLLQGRGW